jgi:serine/threonine-protein kinase
VVGQTPSQAAAILSRAGFTGAIAQTSQVVTDASQVGKILRQNPDAGSRAGVNDTFQVVVGAAGASSGDTGGVGGLFGN